MQKSVIFPAPRTVDIDTFEGWHTSPHSTPPPRHFRKIAKNKLPDQQVNSYFKVSH